MQTEAQKRASAKYHLKCKRLLLVLNPDTDSDVIKLLEEVDNKSAYIKQLLRNECTEHSTICEGGESFFNHELERKTAEKG